MEDTIRQALARDRTIDITTTGRRSGRPRRLETWFYNVGGRVYLSGMPGRRSWYANLRSNPEFTFHLKQSVRADLAARARPVLDRAERRRVLEGLLEQIGHSRDLDVWVERSPLVEVEFAES